MNHINTKVLLGLGTATLVAVIAAVLVASQRQPSSEPQFKTAFALPDLHAHINEVKGLRLTVAEEKPAVTLDRNDPGWTVKEKGGYPADTGKLRETLLKLADATLLEPKTQSEPRYPELGVEDLKSKDAKGVLVDLEGLPKPARLIVGNPSAKGQGTFVRVPGQKQSWLAKGNLSLERDPVRWLDTVLVDIPASRIAEITVSRPGGKPIRIYKEQPGDAAYKIADLPLGRQPAASVNGLASNLSGLNFVDVAPAAAAHPPAEGKQLRSHYRTFEGLVVEIQAWKQDDKPNARFSASVDQAAADARFQADQALVKADYEAKQKQKEKAASEEAPSGPPDPAPPAVADPARDRQQRLATLNQEAETLNKRFEGWTFALPVNVYSNLDKSLEDFSQPVAEKKEAKPQTRPRKPAAGKH